MHPPYAKRFLLEYAELVSFFILYRKVYSVVYSYTDVIAISFLHYAEIHIYHSCKAKSGSDSLLAVVGGCNEYVVLPPS